MLSAAVWLRLAVARKGASLRPRLRMAKPAACGRHPQGAFGSDLRGLGSSCNTGCGQKVRRHANLAVNGSWQYANGRAGLNRDKAIVDA